MMLKNRTFDINYGILAMLGAFFFLPFLGAVHLFDWDEINFAESAREMIVTGDYLRVRIDYEPFWEKPPFFFWLQVLSMKLFGINEYAARLPNALTGIATLLVLYSLGKKQHGPQFGWLWAVIYGGGILPHFYFKSGIIDPVFNLFIFLSVYFLYRATEEKAGSLKYAVAAGLFNGLAVLTKGPVGFLLMFLAWVVVMAMGRFKALPSWKDILGFAVPFVVVTFFWYGFEVINNGPWFLVEFIKYQIELFSQPVAGHQQPLYYHFIVVFFGCFPFSFYALPAFTKRLSLTDPLRVWMKAIFWVVMILFSIVTTKIVHYSSMAYLPLSYLGATYIFQLGTAHNALSKSLRIGFLGMGVIVSLLFIGLPIVMYNREMIYPYIKDAFAVASMQIEVAFTGFEFLLGVFYLGVVILGYLLLKKNLLKGVQAISLGTCLLLFGVLAIMVPKIEQFSQYPEIVFFKEMKGQDVYVQNIGFKSYAQYYYFEQPDDQNPNRRNKEWLINGDIDKPVYFITKVTKKELDQYPHIKFLRQDGGFNIYVREVGSYKSE